MLLRRLTRSKKRCQTFFTSDTNTFRICGGQSLCAIPSCLRKRVCALSVHPNKITSRYSGNECFSMAHCQGIRPDALFVLHLNEVKVKRIFLNEAIRISWTSNALR